MYNIFIFFSFLWFDDFDISNNIVQIKKFKLWMYYSLFGWTMY